MIYRKSLFPITWIHCSAIGSFAHAFYDGVLEIYSTTCTSEYTPKCAGPSIRLLAMHSVEQGEKLLWAR